MIQQSSFKIADAFLMGGLVVALVFQLFVNSEKSETIRIQRAHIERLERRDCTAQTSGPDSPAVVGSSGDVVIRYPDGKAKP